MISLIKQINNFFFGHMGFQIGPWDPLKLTFNLMNNLMERGIIKYDDAAKILKQSLPDDMPENEKDEIISKMLVRI